MSRYPTDSDFEPRVADWLESDPDIAPAPVLSTVLAAFPSIPQRRASRVPWRFPPMSTFAKVAIAAVVLIAVGSVGIMALQPSGGRTVGSAPTPSPSPAPSPSPTPFPSPTAAPSLPPPLSETFTSPTNGISIAYPAGWRTKAATQPFTMNGWPPFESPNGDFMYDDTLQDHLFIALASQPLAGKTGDKWAADALAADDCAPTEPVTIDGASGFVGVECNFAAFSLGGRGYVVVLYTSGDEPGLEAYDRAWFERLLTTIHLSREDAASASPSAAP